MNTPPTSPADPPWARGPWPLRRKILLLALLPLLVSLGLIALAVRSQAQDLAARERVLVESAYLQSKENELRNHVDVAMSMIAPLYDSGRDDDATKAEAARILQSLHYGAGDGYFFAYDYHGLNIVHPIQPELLGKNLWDVRDSEGRPVVQALIALAKSGSGYFRYLWNKPSVRQETPKLSYVVGLQRWQWMMGTGVYLDDIQATLDQLDKQVSNNIWTTMLWIAAIALLGLSLVAGSALALNLSAYRQADAQLQLMARQVVQSQENERAHLARELHDGTSQTLVSIKLLMDSALQHLGRGLPGTQGLMEKARGRVFEALTEVRQISHRLRPVMLDTLGLPAALRSLGEEFAEHAQIAFFMRVHGDQQDLPDEIKTVLFRVTQEALTNIEKHAGATRVDLRLIFHPSGVRLSVFDDGQGFDLAAVQANPRSGIGLRNMQERLASVAGTCLIASAPGLTRVRAQVPRAAILRFTPGAMTAPPKAHAAPSSDFSPPTHAHPDR
jgi:two-component system, NarL family, sensor kinase